MAQAMFVTRIRTVRSISAFFAALALASGVAASDGVLEINQACVATGCFGGDEADFPVTIDAPGSYQLTSNLVVTSAVDAIQVRAGRVRIDLNGFTIDGSSTGTIGVSTGGRSNVQGTVVRNGTIRNFTDDGIFITPISVDTRIEGMQVLSNGGDGVTVDDGSAVVDSGVFGNGGNGVVLPVSTDDARVSGCIIADNGGAGIQGSGNFSANVIFSNTGDGVSGRSLVVEHNAIRGNGGDGVEATFSAMLSENAIYLNSGYGIRENSANGRKGYARNSINTNTLGTISEIPQELEANVCNGNLNCP